MWARKQVDFRLLYTFPLLETLSNCKYFNLVDQLTHQQTATQNYCPMNSYDSTAINQISLNNTIFSNQSKMVKNP